MSLFFFVVVSIGRGMLGEIRGCFWGSQKLHQIFILVFLMAMSESFRLTSGCRELQSDRPDSEINSTNMFMLPFETRDSKHRCF
jgi:hypothetical protein